MFIIGSTAAGISSNHNSLFCESWLDYCSDWKPRCLGGSSRLPHCLIRRDAAQRMSAQRTQLSIFGIASPFLYLFHRCKFHNTFGLSPSTFFGAYERHLQVRRYFTGKSNEAAVSSADIRAFAAVTRGYIPPHINRSVTPSKSTPCPAVPAVPAAPTLSSLVPSLPSEPVPVASNRPHLPPPTKNNSPKSATSTGSVSIPAVGRSICSRWCTKDVRWWDARRPERILAAMRGFCSIGEINIPRNCGIGRGRVGSLGGRRCSGGSGMGIECFILGYCFLC
ncbi:uncharacterized protein K444DRAFT_166697 [Hyaloscypha bicolor E]|uniref:Uncharacterized protein n=1 Tax=Hyaloscypha bicolor E TaxID=1095630 RepID=A0A2J6TT88_9HELO|nr:uncharacterized protein K444DRAFT_166697 [Hyaloscypha bicolor E]PMD66230.1 hypothetical protein K444DRAFT_166697 [Hyaloscypha bicolor E]